MIIHELLLIRTRDRFDRLRRPVQTVAAPPRRATNSRRLIAPQVRHHAKFDFQLGLSKQKSASSEMGSNGQIGAVKNPVSVF